MLDRQEATRVAQLKAREDKIKGLMGSMAEGVVKKNKEKEVEEERRIQSAYDDQVKKNIERELSEAEAKRDERKNNQEFLFRQMKDRDDKKAVEKGENTQQAQVFKMQAEQALADDETKKSTLKVKSMALQNQIKGQMGDKDTVKGKKKQMDANETKMNNALLKKMGKDIMANKMI
jgi:hypothetical protein